MESQITVADARGEIDGANQECEDSGECMRDEETAVGDDLQTVGVVHGVIGDKKNFRSDEDKERYKTKGDPENGFESGSAGVGNTQCGSCHYSPFRCFDVTTTAARANGVKSFMFLSLTRRFRMRGKERLCRRARFSLDVNRLFRWQVGTAGSASGHREFPCCAAGNSPFSIAALNWFLGRSQHGI